MKTMLGDRIAHKVKYVFLVIYEWGAVFICHHMCHMTLRLA